MTIAARLRAALARAEPITNRQRLALAAAAAVFLAAPLASHLRKALVTQHGDWLSIYNIAAHSLRTRELRPDPNERLVITQRYPPIARPLLMVFALPPKTVSAVCSFGLFAALYAWSARQIGGWVLRPDMGGRCTAAALVLALAGPYIWADLVACNLTSVLLASVTAAFVFAARGRPWRAGLALSIGVMLKLIPILCLIFFLVRRQWRTVWGTLAGLVAFGVAPSLLIFGPRQFSDYHREWYRDQFVEFTPMHAIDTGVECSYQNQSVVRVLTRLLTHTNAGRSEAPFYIQVAAPPRWAIKAAYVTLVGVTGMGLVWILWRTRAAVAADAAGFALCVGAMLWFSPWVGSYYFPLAMWPAAVVLAKYLGSVDDATRRRSSGVALAMWLLAMPALASQVLRALGASLWAALALLLVLAGTLNARGRSYSPTT